MSLQPRAMLRAAVLALVAVATLDCGKPASAASDASGSDDSGARVDGDRLVLRANDPQVAALATTIAANAAADLIRIPGRVVWDEDVTVRVFSPFAGRVVRVLSSAGEHVRAGQTLALIASPDFGQAEADARRATTDLTLAKRSAERTRDLLAHGVAAQKDLEAAEADLARARAESERALSRLAMYGGDTSTANQAFPLRAPLGGLVVDRAVTPGQEVRPDQMLANAPQLFAPLFLITDPSRLWVVLDVPERDMPFVTVGADVTVRTNGGAGQSVVGRITQISGAMDPSTRTLKARAVISNPTGMLKAEMLVSANLAAQESRGVIVPAAAVLLEGGDHVAYVDEGQGRLHRVPVVIGAQQGAFVHVLSGLAAGQRVVTGGALLFEQLYQAKRAHS